MAWQGKIKMRTTLEIEYEYPNEERGEIPETIIEAQGLAWEDFTSYLDRGAYNDLVEHITVEAETWS